MSDELIHSERRSDELVELREADIAFARRKRAAAGRSPPGIRWQAVIVKLDLRFPTPFVGSGGCHPRGDERGDGQYGESCGKCCFDHSSPPCWTHKGDHARPGAVSVPDSSVTCLPLESFRLPKR